MTEDNRNIFPSPVSGEIIDEQMSLGLETNDEGQIDISDLEAEDQIDIADQEAIVPSGIENMSVSDEPIDDQRELTRLEEVQYHIVNQEISLDLAVRESDTIVYEDLQIIDAIYTTL